MQSKQHENYSRHFASNNTMLANGGSCFAGLFGYLQLLYRHKQPALPYFTNTSLSYPTRQSG